MAHTAFRVGCLLVPLGLLVSLGGCPADTGGTTESQLKVNFDASGGNYAVAKDKEGNQYTFRARQEPDGTTTITEANILTTAGKELKLSLDSTGRPVNVRLSDNTAADLVYDGENVNIRLTDANGNQTASKRGVKASTKKDFVRAQRLENFSKAEARFAGKSAKLDTLQKGLEACEEVIVSITDPATNPECPLIGSSLEKGIKNIASVASTAEVDEVAVRDDLGSDVTVDKIPAKVQALAGQTYILFDAEGFCLEFTDVANRLTFDNNGVLTVEFDRHLVFPDLSVNQSGDRTDPGITINYGSLTELNLTPDDIGFDLTVQPIFTGTQLDDAGKITIERRFNADLTFPVELFGTATAEAHKLFDIAFINGELSDDNAVLALDLVLVDLEEQTPVATLGQLRYFKQGVPQPARIYSCEYDPQQQAEADPERGIDCPTDLVSVGDPVTITFSPGSTDLSDVQYDWFISKGEGVINGSSGEEEVSITGTEQGLLEVTLLLHDLSTDPEVLSVFTCSFSVGVGENTDTPSAGELQGFCPTVFVVNEPGRCWVEGSLLESLSYKEWYVLGAMYYDVSAPNAAATQITFYETGFFTVVFEGYTEAGDPAYLWQDIEVVASGDGTGPEPGLSPWAGEYEGDLTEPASRAQEIFLIIEDDGTVTGLAVYDGGAEYNLYGFALDDGYIYFVDDAPDTGYALGIYEGMWDTDGFVGTYFEDDDSNPIGEWAVFPS
jgi:hypothetical protein